MTPPISMNREAWLTAIARAVEPLYAGFTLSPYRVTMGWPSSKGLGKRLRVVGECHGARTSKAGLFELFISPVLEDPVEVAGTVCHELAHVVAGIEARHGKAFVEVAKHIGLTKGKPTSAGPGDSLTKKLKSLTEGIGPYPHSAIVPSGRVVVRAPSSFTLECSTCGCRVTMGKKWLLTTGPPTCACGGTFTTPPEVVEVV